MAEPCFQIHRIKRISDGRAFAHWRYWGVPRTGSQWYDEGVFFRRMETIRKHLRWLRDGDKLDLGQLYVESFTVNTNTRAVSEALRVVAGQDLSAPVAIATPTPPTQ